MSESFAIFLVGFFSCLAVIAIGISSLEIYMYKTGKLGKHRMMDHFDEAVDLGNSHS